jgi:hypothetical protein
MQSRTGEGLLATLVIRFLTYAAATTMTAKPRRRDLISPSNIPTRTMAIAILEDVDDVIEIGRSEYPSTQQAITAKIHTKYILTTENKKEQIFLSNWSFW